MQRFLMLGLVFTLLAGCAMTPEQRMQFAQGVAQYERDHPPQPMQFQPTPVQQAHTSQTTTNCSEYVPGQVQCQSTTTGN